jgi:hypothetical protein
MYYSCKYFISQCLTCHRLNFKHHCWIKFNLEIAFWRFRIQILPSSQWSFSSRNMVCKYPTENIGMVQKSLSWTKFFTPTHF